MSSPYTQVGWCDSKGMDAGANYKEALEQGMINTLK